MLLTANLFPLLCFGIASILNTIAIAYHSLAAVPFGSIVILLLIWMFISFPLCLFGTVQSLLPPFPTPSAYLSSPPPLPCHFPLRSLSSTKGDCCCHGAFWYRVEETGTTKNHQIFQRHPPCSGVRLERDFWPDYFWPDWCGGVTRFPRNVSVIKP